ncbi:MAG TPA: hypothetical protein VLX29_11130 [Nitrospirota bacterium]|nr:hypothetical protein [Nitrospirota bacterium]
MHETETKPRDRCVVQAPNISGKIIGLWNDGLVPRLPDKLIPSDTSVRSSYQSYSVGKSSASSGSLFSQKSSRSPAFLAH